MTDLCEDKYEQVDRYMYHSIKYVLGYTCTSFVTVNCGKDVDTDECDIHEKTGNLVSIILITFDKLLPTGVKPVDCIAYP